MKIAIVHHHLRRGGVTRVIERAVDTLDLAAGVQALVISGEPGGNTALKLEIEPALRYAADGGCRCGIELARKLKEAANRHFGDLPDIWHFHNHSLGKNPALTDALAGLAKDRPLLLQLHDFAEDGRPANYLRILESKAGPEKLYPVGHGIHYAVLNNRDDNILGIAGVPRSHRFILPNPVPAPDFSSEQPPPPINGRYWLYPTRAIRRKNLGEFILLAAISQNDELHFATTLTPQNPAERTYHDNWVEFLRNRDLPVTLGVGELPGTSFDGLVSHAEAIVTTSIAEGFGLAFLEPWAARKPLAGRNLPEITGDFCSSGIDLSMLYQRLEIPAKLVDLDAIKAAYSKLVANTFDAYKRPWTAHTITSALDTVVVNNHIDFGALDESLQQGVIDRIRNDPATLKESIGFPKPVRNQVVTKNHKAVAESYSPDRIGKLYLERLQTIANSRPGIDSFANHNAVLSEFLSPIRLRLLRS